MIINNCDSANYFDTPSNANEDTAHDSNDLVFHKKLSQCMDKTKEQVWETEDSKPQ